MGDDDEDEHGNAFARTLGDVPRRADKLVLGFCLNSAGKRVRASQNLDTPDNADAATILNGVRWGTELVEGGATLCGCLRESVRPRPHSLASLRCTRARAIPPSLRSSRQSTLPMFGTRSVARSSRGGYILRDVQRASRPGKC
jgi:hypothetical protein